MNKSRWLAGLALLVIVVFVAGLGSRLSLVAPVETTFSVRPGRTSTGNTFGCQRCGDETTKPSNTRGAHNPTGANDSPSITAVESESWDGNKTAHLEVFVAQWRNGSITLEQAVAFITGDMEDAGQEQ